MCGEVDGKLNAKSIFIEGSRGLSNGFRVRLDLSQCRHYAVFPVRVRARVRVRVRVRASIRVRVSVRVRVRVRGSVRLRVRVRVRVRASRVRVSRVRWACGGPTTRPIARRSARPPTARA